jgi:NTE family protein
MMLVAMLLSACASLTVVDTTPLPASKLEPPGSETISDGGYRIDSVTRVRQIPDLLILVAMSGGGKRSAAYAYGALKGMGQVTIPGDGRSLLSQLDGISGISGGSFTAAYYGLHRDNMFGQYEKDVLYSDTNAYIFGIYLLPWNWGWIADPTVGTNDYMERVYDRTMFHGAKYKDLKALGRPIIAIGATDISYGAPFLFTQEGFDIICSDLSEFPLARAVAASNGFPGLFSPITLTNHAADCGGRVPGWERRVTAEERRNPLSRIGTQAQLTDRYLDPNRTKYVHLADGGISDNLGLRVAGSMMETMAASPETIRTLGYDHLRRVLVISVDGQGAQDASVAQRKIVGGLFSLLGLVSGGQIDRYNFETLSTVSSQIKGVVRAIQNARCSEGKVVYDTPCDDVQGELVHISLAAMPDSPEKDQLLAIPTGLSLPQHDVDLLVAAGATAVTTSEPLRQFLDNYPPRLPAMQRATSGQKGLPRS